MLRPLLKVLPLIIVFSSCSRSVHNSKRIENNAAQNIISDQPIIAGDRKPQSLMDLPQSQDGGFVLAPGYYEAEFKSYCLQPGTPDPRQGDAYLQTSISGYRKEIVESVLLNSKTKPELDQKNIQLLLWSVVSGSDFNKLSYAVQSDARELLTSKQIFELQGGVLGLVKTVSYQSGLLNANSDIKRLFEMGTSSYETYERLAVRREPSKIVKSGVKYDKWYKQKENYYVRYFPASYQQLRIQVFVPDSLLDKEGKVNGEYVVFDPTGKQAIPAFTNAQRLGIGAPVLAGIIRKVIQIKKSSEPEKKTQERKEKTPANSKTGKVT